jgi:hypothetical protein
VFPIHLVCGMFVCLMWVTMISLEIIYHNITDILLKVTLSTITLTHRCSECWYTYKQFWKLFLYNMRLYICNMFLFFCSLRHLNHQLMHRPLSGIIGQHHHQCHHQAALVLSDHRYNQYFIFLLPSFCVY